MDKALIYAVDDEETIRELYSFALKGSGFLSECFENADNLFVALKQNLPDLILLDVMLDGLDGFQILEKLKNNADYREIPVIMVSAKGEELSKVKGLNLGADDYIAKPFGVMELIARINANLRKVKVVKKTVVFKDIVIDDLKHEAFIGKEKAQLTLKEYEMLKLLASNPDTVILRDDILNKVWGEDYFGETRTLDMHVNSLRKKLAESQAEIVTVRGVGYKIE